MSDPRTGRGAAWRDMDTAAADGATLLSGPVVWGAIGYGLDRLFGFSALFLPIGLVLGIVAATWLVVMRRSAR